MASTDTLQTTLQNLAQAVNGLINIYTAVQGQKNATDITATTLVRTGQGRLATVSVMVAGSAVGAIYDNSDVASTLRQIYVIPKTVGPVFVNMPVGYGIVVAPGSGQTVAVSYS